MGTGEPISRSVFLVGPMAAGKTTIGKLLAAELGLRFVDADQELEERAGADISWIFDVEGEAGFREREARIIDELTRLRDVLLATGGGAVLSEANRERLRSRGTVIFLDTSVELQLARTRKDKTRPLLETADPRGTLMELKEHRDPLYRDVADFRFFTGERNVGKLVADIISTMKDAGYPRRQASNR